MDDCDIALLVHTSNSEKKGIGVSIGNNGCLTKNIDYEGVSSHAGGAPHLGVNALYAANLGLNAVNALRETFQEKDYIRFHPIVTRGGGAVNAIPNDVRVESYVRGASIEAIVSANNRINRALASSAAAMGANVHLQDYPGYCPLYNDKNLYQITVDVVKEAFGEDYIQEETRWGTGCTDMGDVSCVMPTVQPMASGASGVGHGSDYCISDPENALVVSAQYQVLMAEALLANDGALAKKVIAEAELVYPDKKDYFAAIDKIFLDKKAVTANEDGTITLDYQNL